MVIEKATFVHFVLCVGGGKRCIHVTVYLWRTENTGKAPNFKAPTQTRNKGHHAIIPSSRGPRKSSSEAERDMNWEFRGCQQKVMDIMGNPCTFVAC